MPIWIEQDPEYLKKYKGVIATTTTYVEGDEGEEEEEEEEEDAKHMMRARVGDRVIVIGKRTGGESLAHEIGHVMSGHTQHPESSSEMARREVEAWLWAKRKRGGYLRANIVARTLANLVRHYPNMSDDELILTIREAYYDIGEKPPSEDYIRRVIEKEYGLED